MQTRRPLNLCRLGIGPALLLLAACQPSAAAPATKIVVNVRVPATDDNPLASPDAHFIALTADYPGSDGTNYTVQPYAQGVKVTVPNVPFGAGRQIRVEVYNGTTGPTVAFARGTSVPVNVDASSPSVELHPYVTRINNFAPVFGEPNADGVSAPTTLPIVHASLPCPKACDKCGDGICNDAATMAACPATASCAEETLASCRADCGPLASHVATAMAPLPNGKVLVVGGGAPKAGAKNPFDPASYASFQQTVGVYDPDSRAMSYASDPTGLLATGRAFHTLAVGQNYVAIVGGIELDEVGKARSSRRIEFYNIATGEVTVPTQTESTMKFGRSTPTVIQMFEHQDYFLVLGGQGNETCPANPRDGMCGGNTWEIWHATGGFRTMGQLNKARWHHAGVRVPGPDSGGFVMLVGGENNQGALTTMELVQFSVLNNNVLVSDSALNCPAECPDSPPKFLWNPAEYPDQKIRIWPAALFVANSISQYYHVYMIGGFNDIDHKSANKTVDVFDIQAGAIVASPQMGSGRAAPIVAAVTSGPSTGQLLIAGGSATDTSHLNTGEFLHVDACTNAAGDPALCPNINPVENGIGDGDRTLGAAMGLSTGHILMLGGTGGNASSLTGRTDATLWNPY